MTQALSDLLPPEQKPVTVRKNDKVTAALALMKQGDFSQLPVVDDEGVVQGLVSYESIMRAVAQFKTSPDAMAVSTALVKAQKRTPDEDLLGLLSLIRGAGYALIVDATNRLLYIITSYDVMEYYRKRAEDMMLVENIETMVRDLILHAFTDKQGNLDEAVLNTAILKINTEREDLRRKFRRGLGQYLQLAGAADGVAPKAAEQSFDEVWPQDEPKAFERLTLNEFIALLCSKDRWDTVCGPLLGEPLFRIAADFKPSGSDVFGSKFCHLLFPGAYPVRDNAFTGPDRREPYAAYWSRCACGWRESCERDVLVKTLRVAMDVEPVAWYPWGTKIAELCQAGARAAKD